MKSQILMMIKSPAKILLLLLLLSLLHQITNANLTDQELDFALSSLRSHGYSLFPNAIATSDIRYHLLNQSQQSTSSLTTTTFTLFSPPDSLLFSLDLASTAPHYTKSLSLHVSPSRLTTSELINVTANNSSGGPYIDSLVPNHRLSINNSLVVLNGTVFESVSVNGVRVSLPDLFLGSCIAVHGLDGILVAGFQDADADTSFVASSTSPAEETWSLDLNSPLARSSPAARPRSRANGRMARRNGDQSGNNLRGREFHGGRHGGGNGRTGGRGVSGGRSARFNHH